MAVENENKLSEIIQAFADTGFIDDVILIGSWCLSFYVEVFEGFVPSVRTTDMIFTFPIANELTPRTLVSDLNQLTMTIFRIR